MNCEQMTAALSAFLDGELTAQEQAQVNEHLEQCPECRALFEQLQTLHTSFSDLEEIPAPENFAQGVMNRIKAEEKPKVIPLFKRPQIRAVMGLAACAVLCIGFGRVALMGGKGGSAAPMAPEAAMPESAAYDAAEYSIEQMAGNGMEARAESAPMERAEMPAPEASEPAAPPAAEPAEAPAELQGDVKNDGESEKVGGETVIVLNQLPEGVEEVIGPLDWEEREADGALCARLTADQAGKLMELASAQGLAVEQTVSADGEPEQWTLVLTQ